MNNQSQIDKFSRFENERRRKMFEDIECERERIAIAKRQKIRNRALLNLRNSMREITLDESLGRSEILNAIDKLRQNAEAVLDEGIPGPTTGEITRLLKAKKDASRRDSQAARGYRDAVLALMDHDKQQPNWWAWIRNPGSHAKWEEKKLRLEEDKENARTHLEHCDLILCGTQRRLADFDRKWRDSEEYKSAEADLNFRKAVANLEMQICDDMRYVAWLGSDSETWNFQSLLMKSDKSVAENFSEETNDSTPFGP